MESKSQENTDSKAEFRKSWNDGSNRKYRRRSPLSRSSYSPDGSPHGDRSSSPVASRKNSAKVADDSCRNDDDMEVDMDYRRGQSGRNSQSYTHSDRQSSRSYHRHDNNSRHDKQLGKCDRDYSKSSYHSGRDSRDNRRFVHSNKDHRSRYHPKDVDTYTRDKSDGSVHRNRDVNLSDIAGSGRRLANIESGDRDKDRDRHREDAGDRDGKTGHWKSLRDHIDSSPPYERHDSTSQGEDSGHHLKEASQRGTKSLDGVRYTREGKRRHDERGGYKEREPEEHPEDTKAISCNDQELGAKKSILFNSMGPGTNGTIADEKHSTSKPAHDTAETVPDEMAYVKDSDIDAAKVAAMKAAALVNRNLIGTGYMSTDQKKRLLWGNKNTTVEEPTRQWNTAMFGDQERQEKFNKLMSLRLHWYLWPIVGRERQCKSGSQARQPQCAKAAGTAPVRFGEAIHSWTAQERWSNCRTWPLKVFLVYLCSWNSLFNWILSYCTKHNFCKMLRIHLMGSFWFVIKTIKVDGYGMHKKLLLICFLECFLALLESIVPSQT